MEKRECKERINKRRERKCCKKRSAKKRVKKRAKKAALAGQEDHGGKVGGDRSSDSSSSIDSSDSDSDCNIACSGVVDSLHLMLVKLNLWLLIITLLTTPIHLTIIIPGTEVILSNLVVTVKVLNADIFEVKCTLNLTASNILCLKFCAQAQSPQAPDVVALSCCANASCEEGVHTYPTHLPAEATYEHYFSEAGSHKCHDENVLPAVLKPARQVSRTHPHFGRIPV